MKHCDSRGFTVHACVRMYCALVYIYFTNIIVQSCYSLGIGIATDSINDTFSLIFLRHLTAILLS